MVYNNLENKLIEQEKAMIERAKRDAVDEFTKTICISLGMRK